MKDAALRLLEEDAHFRPAVREGIEQAGRGEFIDPGECIDEAEMKDRLEPMLRA